MENRGLFAFLLCFVIGVVTHVGAAEKTNTEYLDFKISYYDVVSRDWDNLEEAKKQKARNIEDVIRYWSDALYEATNGQHCVGNVYIYQNMENPDKVHVVWGKNQVPPKALVGGYHLHFGGFFGSIQFGDVIFSDGYDYLVDPNDRAKSGYTLAHETGHYVYYMQDEYKKDPPHDPTNEPLLYEIWHSLYHSFALSLYQPCACDISPEYETIMCDQTDAVTY